MRDFRDYVKDKLKDPEEAVSYLNTALEEYEKDQDGDAFLLALRTVAEARGGLTELARKTNLNRQNLYRTLSKKGNPRLNTLETVLHGLGFRLSIVPVES
ncbi:MAG: putative addiction module antidote protein [bacterium]|nr:putative addiction module antidote protein [bacterium]